MELWVFETCALNCFELLLKILAISCIRNCEPKAGGHQNRCKVAQSSAIWCNGQRARLDGKANLGRCPQAGLRGRKKLNVKEQAREAPLKARLQTSGLAKI